MAIRGSTVKKSRLICGVGINDADYPTQRNSYSYVDEFGKTHFIPKWTCQFYRRWYHILVRCHSDKKYARESNRAYDSCSVCEDWKKFTNFKAWMEKQDWEDKHIDKDILVKGNKVYGPDTCVFVSTRLNNFLLEANAARGKYLLGVYFATDRQKFRACTNWNDTTINLGTFVCEKEAHLAYCKKKLEFAYKIIDEEKPEQRVVDAIIKRYKDQLTEAEKLLSIKDFQEEI